MSKIIKITKQQISNMINEEVKRFEKVKKLENQKNDILKTLTEMYDIQELSEMGVDEGILGDFGNKMKKAFGHTWTQEQAEQTFNQIFTRNIKSYAETLQTDPQTLKNALVNIMMQLGGLAVLNGAGKNVDWDPATKTFTKIKHSVLGGPGSGTGALGGY